MIAAPFEAITLELEDTMLTRRNLIHQNGGRDVWYEMNGFRYHFESKRDALAAYVAGATRQMTVERSAACRTLLSDHALLIWRPYMTRVVEKRRTKTRRRTVSIQCVINAYNRNFAGGGAFGWDWPTFHLNDPERCAEARRLIELINGSSRKNEE